MTDATKRPTIQESAETIQKMIAAGFPPSALGELASILRGDGRTQPTGDLRLVVRDDGSIRADLRSVPRPRGGDDCRNCGASKPVLGECRECGE